MIRYLEYIVTGIFFLFMIPIMCTPWFASLKIYFDEAYLIYDVKNDSVNIVTEGAIIDYGKNWAVKKAGESTFHIMQTCNDNEMKFFWKIDTLKNEIYRVDNGRFGKPGGQEIFIHDIEVDIEGDRTDPEKLTLKFPHNSVSICYSAGGALYDVIIYDYVYKVLDINEKVHPCTDPTDFEGLSPYEKPTYFKHKKWDNFYWLVDLNKVYLVEGTPGEKTKKVRELNTQIGSCYDNKIELARLVLKNAFLKYESNKQYPQVIVNNAIKTKIDEGIGWELKMMGQGIYHLSHIDNLYGPGKFWKIDVINKAVFRVEEGTFGKSVGKETLLKKIIVDFQGNPENPDSFILKFPIGSVYFDTFDFNDVELTVYDFKYECDTSFEEKYLSCKWVVEELEKPGEEYSHSRSIFKLVNSQWRSTFWVVDRLYKKVYTPVVNLKKTYHKIANLVPEKLLKNLLSGRTDIFYPFVIDTRTDEIIYLEFYY